MKQTAIMMAVVIGLSGMAVLAREEVNPLKTKHSRASGKGVSTTAEERHQKREARKNRAQEGRQNAIDNRQERQARRIQHGINKGYLTDEETKQLQAQQASIAALENSLSADGNLTGNEFRQLQSELNEASRSIWAEKHDTEGNQMPVYRLGENVVAKDSLTAKLASGEMTRAEAKALLKDFRRMMELMTRLSGDLSESERAALQSEYDTLLNEYFELK